MDVKIPIHEEAENAVIASCFIDKEAVVTVCQHLTPADFYIENNRALFRAIKHLFKEGEPIEYAPIIDALNITGSSIDRVTMPYILGLHDFVVTAAYIDNDVAMVKKYSNLRNIINATAKAMHQASRAQKTVEDITFELQQDLMNMSNAAANEFVQIGKKKEAIEERLVNKMERRGVVGMSTGFIDLDAMSGGLIPGELIIIAARPGMGKSALAAQIAANVAKEHVVLMVSLEMLPEQIGLRLVVNKSHVDLKRGKFSKLDYDRLHRALDDVAELNLYINDGTPIKTTEIRAKALAFAAKHGIGLLIVDYMGLVKMDNDNRVIAMGNLTKVLLDVARHFPVPVIALSQLSRAVENRPNKRPMLHDLRDSGEIEQDANQVWFLYREGYYDKDSVDDNIRSHAELIIAKNRDGATGTVDLLFEPTHVQFRNKAKRY